MWNFLNHGLNPCPQDGKSRVLTSESYTMIIIVLILLYRFFQRHELRGPSQQLRDVRSFLSYRSGSCSWRIGLEFSLKKSILTSLGCHGKILPTRWLNRNLYLHSLEARCTRSRSWQGWFLMRSLFLDCRQLFSYCVLTWSFVCVYTSLGKHIYFNEHKLNSLEFQLMDFQEVLRTNNNLFLAFHLSE